MTNASFPKVLRPFVIPIAMVVGFIITPAMLVPSADELRRRGGMVDGTGYGSAALLGLLLGAIAGYVIPTILDYSIWWAPENADRDQST
jgi:hypothetical protein